MGFPAQTGKTQILDAQWFEYQRLLAFAQIDTTDRIIGFQLPPYGLQGLLGYWEKEHPMGKACRPLGDQRQRRRIDPTNLWFGLHRTEDDASFQAAETAVTAILIEFVPHACQGIAHLLW
jgi:hypothetical protein